MYLDEGFKNDFRTIKSCWNSCSSKISNKIKHIEFIRLNEIQIMSIIASTNGQVENRIIRRQGNYTQKIF